MEKTILVCILAYLLGSISGARVTALLYHTVNPTSSGSQNPGATNMYRIGGFKAGLLTFVLDLLKGLIAIWTAFKFELSADQTGLVAVACCSGHIWPIFHKFKGGKAVACALGCIFPVASGVASSLLVIWVITMFLFHYASLASICAVLACPVLLFAAGSDYSITYSVLSLLIVWRHRNNIKRLLNGQEDKF
ncbi:glycerol-3-phosphate 1-O-acyltransferase PlsY [Gayadomonas joobiniege]|uniref:glycerol-3-phosphate 1-O-acyltransferase PlsY n=1 Tax=Gayadomonas joobiniege TaxID=1234606 RepID=UPI00036EB272|nr:glycerol-3-phosphate 1-O-acyltransferase PlsY [Gayadomonas joobiniege]